MLEVQPQVVLLVAREGAVEISLLIRIWIDTVVAGDNEAEGVCPQLLFWHIDCVFQKLIATVRVVDAFGHVRPEQVVTCSLEAVLIAQFV